MRVNSWGAILFQFRCDSYLHCIGTPYDGRDDCHYNKPDHQSPAWTTEHPVAVSASPLIVSMFPVTPADVAAATMWAFTHRASL